MNHHRFVFAGHKQYLADAAGDASAEVVGLASSSGVIGDTAGLLSQAASAPLAARKAILDAALVRVEAAEVAARCCRLMHDVVAAHVAEATTPPPGLSPGEVVATKQEGQPRPKVVVEHQADIRPDGRPADRWGDGKTKPEPVPSTGTHAGNAATPGLILNHDPSKDEVAAQEYPQKRVHRR